MSLGCIRFEHCCGLLLIMEYRVRGCGFTPKPSRFVPKRTPQMSANSHRPVATRDDRIAWVGDVPPCCLLSACAAQPPHKHGVPTYTVMVGRDGLGIPISCSACISKRFHMALALELLVTMRAVAFCGNDGSGPSSPKPYHLNRGEAIVPEETVPQTRVKRPCKAAPVFKKEEILNLGKQAQVLLHHPFSQGLRNDLSIWSRSVIVTHLESE